LEMYELMVRFLLLNGECMENPTDVKEEEDRKLLEWAIVQRHLYRNDNLDVMRKRLLDRIGFVWQPQAASTKLSSFPKKRPMVAEDEGVVAAAKRARHGDTTEELAIDSSDTYLLI
jgi:Helicase associated domain